MGHLCSRPTSLQLRIVEPDMDVALRHIFSSFLRIHVRVDRRETQTLRAVSVGGLTYGENKESTAA